MSHFSSVIIGNESLVIQCGEMLLQADHPIRAVVTRNPEVRDWAIQKGLSVHAPGSDLAERLKPLSFDWLFSIANLDLISQSVLELAAKGAVNFHDGPLPRYAGLNAPVWALLGGETMHGVSWHMIAGGVDKGDLISQSSLEISPDETALTLNTKCYGAAIDSFATVITGLATGAPSLTAQDLSKRTYIGRDARPDGAARLDFAKSAETLATLVRALDHGDYWNPLACPKIKAGGRLWLVQGAVPAATASGAVSGTIVTADADELTVATGTKDIILSRIRDCFGHSVAADTLARAGDVLPSLSKAEAIRITEGLKASAAHDQTWRDRLESIMPLDLPLGEGRADVPPVAELPLPAGASAEDARTAFALLIARLGGVKAIDLALAMPQAADATPGYLNPWVPVRVETGDSFAATRSALADQIARARKMGGFACDLPARLAGATPPALPAVGICDGPADGCLPGTVLTLALSDGHASLFADGNRMDADSLNRMAARLAHMLAAAVENPGQPVSDIPILPDAERNLVLYDWNDTATDYDANTCLHTFFEAQAARTPDAEALAFEDQSLTYSELNSRANRVAHVLREMGVGPDIFVGLHTPRSVEMLVGALAILKAGGAYVPLDPNYPADRTALYIKDSAMPVIVGHSSLVDDLPENDAEMLILDDDARIARAPDDNIDSGVTADSLAYLIYTSGSTGQPKGVMVEHRNVASFFTGMDERISHDPAGVWLAVTSLSFDISVLELFYTLARGFKLVISSDESRLHMSNGQIEMTGRGMDFSLYFWGNDDGIGRDKYKLLLEGAKFADKNGFTAVWTPERHFHAFGGPYPNPAVTGAAVAAVTENLSVRSGSCVVPLHHTVRVAEEWAVIDNLTNGRAGIGIASGWQPDDFVLRPENTPPNNKPAMYQAIKDLRKLWAGEGVEFPTKSGKPFMVHSQPQPVAKEIPIWVTIAGNPDTWREAGEIGANVLTHLLGQTAVEVEKRIKLYHEALRGAGHDPADHKVTLMLHSFVGRDRDNVRETARGPMKAYMGAAAGLIRLCAWDFPAFKKPKGVKNPFDIDLATLSADEVDAILEFAFERYFEDAGLFGTVEDCLKRVEELKRIGVDEIACLIDYGIPVQKVLEGLFPLAEVLRKSNEIHALDDDDFSVAAQIIRHGVTHLQCTPSMARMIGADDEARQALGRIDHLMIGGEALSGTLVEELGQITDAPIENMYGPTETTIWSTTEAAASQAGVVNIGRPIANTQVYVLDANRQPVPVGVAGELYVAGAGVTRGYWQRPDLTAECFLDDPFARADGGARMYRTGDLARWRADGRLDFLGRTDHQVKLRGYRIEPGEIESALDACPGVRQSVVIAREDTPGAMQLVAYMTTEDAVDDADLKELLAARLPDYMIPAHFVALDSFPLTPNKKIDRRALPAPALRKPGRQGPTAEVAPVGTTLQKVAAIWSGVLGVPDIGPRDNFFDLGGHSLLAVQAHREIRKELDVQSFSITDIFRFPVLSALVETIEQKKGISAQKQPETDTDNAERAAERSDAMARRRAMRARRQSSDA